MSKNHNISGSPTGINALDKKAHSKKNVLQEAMQLHKAGLLSEAKVLYKKALKKQPKNPDVHNMLGNIAMQEGKQNDALKHWKKASYLNPKNPDILSNISGIYINIKQFKEAEEHALRAVALLPEHNKALYNLGTALIEQKKYVSALPVLLEAIKNNPQNPDYHVSAGNTAIGTGEIDQGLNHFKLALTLVPSHKLANYGYTTAIILSLPMAARGNVYMSCLKNTQLDDIFCADILLRLAIHFWVARDIESVQKCLNLFAKTLVQDDVKYNKKHAIMKSYVVFLYGLLETNPTQLTSNLPNKTILLIGDSHCLSYAGESIFVNEQDHHVIPYLIAGTKAWHLGGGEKFIPAYSFHAALDSLPADGQCWLSFGEIDCRLTEGIQTTAANKGKSLEILAKETAETYVEYTANLVRNHGAVPAYLNVPAPNITKLRELNHDLTDKQIKHHIQTILWFNQALQTAATAQGASIIDLHSLTAGSDNTSNEKWHLDEVHLVPNALAAATRCRP